MAADRHDDLDDLDEEPSFEIVVDDPPPARPALSFDLKAKIRRGLIGLVILVLGGGLGTAAYLLTSYDVRDLIGLLDIGEAPPKLSFELPGRGEPAPPPVAGIGGGLLTPPGAPPGGAEMLKALPDDTPPQSKEEAPVAAAAPPPETAPPPAELDALTKAEMAAPKPKSMTKITPAVDESGVPTQPNPRTADKPPSFDLLPPVKGEVKPLIAAPVKDLLRKTQLGELPYPAADGRQPWQVYARPWSGPADKGKVAVVVVDLGLDKAATEAAIAKLPPEVTLAFSPYAPSLDKWIKKARDFGHEVLMQLPAEGPGFPARDPGPFGLLTSASPESNLTRLETVMSKGAGYAGLISLGTTYGASNQVGATLAAIREHGLMYVGAGEVAADKAPVSAPWTALVDQDPFKEAIDMRLNQVSIAARTKGQAIAVVNARPLSLIRLMGWVNDFDGQNLVLAPATTLAHAPGKS
jgi:polysaccharide deacetylase 2 family uncharacterized protein YibQ